MRSCRLIVPVALTALATISLSPALAQYDSPATSQVSGGACSGSNFVLPDANGHILQCNGSTWQRVSDLVWSLSGTLAYYNSGNVAIGTSTGATMLTIAGPISLNEPNSTAITANYSLQTTDSSLVFAPTATLTVTMQSAATYPGRILFMSNTTAFTVVSSSSTSGLGVIPQAGGSAGTAILPATAGAWVELQSNGTSWVIMESGGTSSGGASTLNGITAATASQAGIDNTAYTINWEWNSLATGDALELSSTSTAGTGSNTSYMLNITRSGINANTAHTAYGLSSTVTDTNSTSGTNIAGYFSASGATTSNYGLIVASGLVGIGTTSPNASTALDLSNNTNSMLFPVGTTGQRPTCNSALKGGTRFNSTSTLLEYCNGTNWISSSPCQNNVLPISAGEPVTAAGSTAPNFAIGDGTFIYAAGLGSGAATAALLAYTFTGGVWTLKSNQTTYTADDVYSMWAQGGYVYTLGDNAAQTAGEIQSWKFTTGSPGTWSTPINYTTSLIAPNGGNDQIWGDGIYIYVADSTNGLKAFTVSAGTLTLKATFKPTGADIRTVWGDGTHVYTSDSGTTCATYALTYTGGTTFTTAGTLSGTCADGSYAISGANGYIFLTTSGYAYQGPTYAYTYSGSTFTQVATLPTPLPFYPNTVFAYGNVVYFGTVSIADPPSSALPFATYAYDFNGSTFTFAGRIPSIQQATPTYSDGTYVYVADTFLDWIIAWPVCH